MGDDDDGVCVIGDDDDGDNDEGDVDGDDDVSVDDDDDGDGDDGDDSDDDNDDVDGNDEGDDIEKSCLSMFYLLNLNSVVCFDSPCPEIAYIYSESGLKVIS